MNEISEERRRAIIREIAESMPRCVVRESFMFTAAEMAQETGRPYVVTMKDLQRKAANGELRSDQRGYDPVTGRRVTLFWRPEDEPARCLGACGNDG